MTTRSRATRTEPQAVTGGRVKLPLRTTLGIGQLQRLAGNRATRSLLAPATVTQRAAPDDRTLRRLVGFELESTWQIEHPGAVKANDPRLAQLSEGDRKSLADETMTRETKLVDQAGKWKMTPDYTATYVPEFQTRAFKETERNGMEAALKDLQKFVDVMAGKDKPIQIGDLAQGQPVAHNIYKILRITPKGPLVLNPQMTAGIQLDKISTYFQDVADGTAGLAGPQQFRDIGQAADRVKEWDDEYRGLITLLAGYVERAQGAKKLKYPKGAISALSRMDLAVLAKQVKTDATKIAGDVARLLRKERSVDDKLFEAADADPKQTRNEQTQILEDTELQQWLSHTQPKVSDWLTDLVKLEADPLAGSWIAHEEPKTQEGQPFGLEEAGSQGNARGVPIELRSLGMNAGWPAAEVYDRALKLFDYVASLHDNKVERRPKIERRGSDTNLGATSPLTSTRSGRSGSFGSTRTNSRLSLDF